MRWPHQHHPEQQQPAQESNQREATGFSTEVHPVDSSHDDKKNNKTRMKISIAMTRKTTTIPLKQRIAIKPSSSINTMMMMTRMMMTVTIMNNNQ